MSTSGYLDEEKSPQSTGLGVTPQCEKCGAPLSVKDTLACRRCGWYASIGAFIEIDKIWEASADPEMEYKPETPPAAPQMPTWLKVLLACVAAVVVVSVLVRLVTPADSLLRTTWSFTQLALGFGAFVVCHFICFGRLMSVKAETNLVDIVISPIKCWTLAIEEMPRRQWVLDTAASGLTAVVMSLVVIGGLDYARLLDWGFKQPPKQSLKDAVIAQGMQIEGEEKSLEEAIEDFAGSQGLNADDPNGKNSDKPAERKEIDCVIIGYEADEQEQVRALILGVEHNTKLVYACRLNPQISEAELQSLTAKLSEWKSRKPYVKLDMEATWVVPKQICRVSYTRQEKSGWLINAEYKGLRGVMNIAAE